MAARMDEVEKLLKQLLAQRQPPATAAATPVVPVPTVEFLKRIQDLETDKAKMAEQLAEVRALVEKQDQVAAAQQASYERCKKQLVRDRLEDNETIRKQQQPAAGGDSELVERDGRKYKLFYGMSSSTAQVKHAGGVAEYRSSEGRTVELPYRGPLDVTVLDILGGLRSACTYVGAAHLKELSKRTTFIRVTAQLNEAFRAHKEPEVPHGYKGPVTGGGAAAAAEGTGAAAAGAGLATPEA